MSDQDVMDMFAGKAMRALIDYFDRSDVHPSKARIAELSYDYAEAMMEERAERKEQDHG